LSLWDVEGRKEVVLLHRDRIPYLALAVNPSGNLLAAGANNGKVITIELAAPYRVTELGYHGDAGVVSCLFGKDDQLVTSARADDRVAVWTIRDTGAPRTKKDVNLTIQSASVLSSNRAITGLMDGRVRFWNLSTGRLIGEQQLNLGPVWHITSFPEAEELIATMQDCISRWRVEETGLVLNARIAMDSGRSALSDDGRYVIFATDELKSLALIDGESGAIETLSNYDRTTRYVGNENANVSRLCAIRRGRTLVAIRSEDSHKNYLEAWDIETRTRIWRVDPGPVDAIRSVAVSEDGRLGASGDWTGGVQIWRMDTGEMLSYPRDARHSASVEFLAFCGDGDRLASGAPRDRQVKLWDTSRRSVPSMLELGGALVSLVASPRGHLWVSSDDRRVSVWDVPHAQMIASLEGDQVAVIDAVSVDGTSAVGHERREGGDVVILKLHVIPGILFMAEDSR
jgi:WD40 repeat protein